MKYNKRIINTVVALVLLALLYLQIRSNNDFGSIKEEWDRSLNGQSFWYLVFVVLLMPLNWFFETLKWKILINKMQEYSIKKAWISVLIGNALAIITPARVGEYAGRLAGIDKDKRPTALTLNFISSISQNTINALFGIVGILVFLNLREKLSDTSYLGYCILGGLSMIVIVILYFNIERILGFVKRIKLPSFISQWTNKLLKIEFLTFDMLKSVLTMSFLRYVVYCTQYMLMLKFIGLNLGFIKIYGGIAMIYLVQSGIPLPPMSGLLARGQIAILVWSGYEVGMASILAATFILWVINLIIPALAGVTLILLNRYNSNRYQDD